MARITLHITEKLKANGTITVPSLRSSQLDSLGSFGKCAKDNEFERGYHQHSDNFKYIG